MQTILNVLAFVLVLGAIVAIHELGHLIAAKIFNVYCAEYSIGMGPKLFQIKGKETKYSIRLLPIGGYVMMAGETEAEQDLFPDDLPPERTVTGLNPWKRIIVQLAGVLMNLLLGVVIFTIVFSFNGNPYKASNEVLGILENSPAEAAGIELGDTIVSVTLEGQESITVTEYDDMDFVGNEATISRIYEVDRNGEILSFEVTPTYFEDRDQYLVGLSFGAQEIGLISAFGVGFRYMIDSSLLIFEVIGQLFRGTGFENVAGPLGIYNVTSQVASQGFIPLLYLTGVLSVNVGIIQLVPLPALDGGRVVFSLWEAITGKPVSQKLEGVLILASFALLFLLIIFVTYKDILNLIN